MKKFLLILTSAWFISVNVSAQGDQTVSWLTSESRTSAYGYGQSATTSAFMEFYVDDLANFKGEGKQIETVKEVLFHLFSDYLSSVTSCKVIIMQGKDIESATEVANETVPSGDLVANWNSYTLSSPYSVDPTLNLYIGYQVSFTGKAFPISVSKGTDSRQSWFRIGTGRSFENVAEDERTFLIKAEVSTVPAPEEEIALASIDIKDNILFGDSIQIKGKIKNIGLNAITSFSVYYKVNNDLVDSHDFTDVNISPKGEYMFTIPKYYVPENPEVVTIEVNIENPNNVADFVEENNQQTAVMKVFVKTIDRIVLHEVFTSSTCPPCRPGNEQLIRVLNSADYEDWACVKYQYTFPGSGDPYYTSECGIRADFYGGISSVPDLFVDGTTSLNPNYYTASIFKNSAAVPAAATITGTSTVDSTSKEFSANIEIVPATDLTSLSDLRFFAAIVEKRTILNAKTNGEGVFSYVLKKFLTKPSGDAIDKLICDTTINLNYDYTFIGNYRLPSNATNPINHNSEHSIEIFNNLMVVYWLQDIKTKEVYQAGKSEPYQGIIIGIEEMDKQNAMVKIFPNPASDKLNIQSDVLFSKISIVNMLGQTIKEINVEKENIELNVSDMAKGLYVLKVETLQGTVTRKIQIK